ncbi:hypothetical protein Salat_1675300 [Sesamum alatum]|uniref:Uncharacterized protein n=1 Tax=Sesamum alatum TaxID=300844 RepID=A0AAE2CJV3_9LAMI|nr:hypothetical protein Salat_1675300 [Sesamum alatum]
MCLRRGAGIFYCTKSINVGASRTASPARTRSSPVHDSSGGFNDGFPEGQQLQTFRRKNRSNVQRQQVVDGLSEKGVHLDYAQPIFPARIPSPTFPPIGPLPRPLCQPTLSTHSAEPHFQASPVHVVSPRGPSTDLDPPKCGLLNKSFVSDHSSPLQFVNVISLSPIKIPKSPPHVTFPNSCSNSPNPCFSDGAAIVGGSDLVPVPVIFNSDGVSF